MGSNRRYDRDTAARVDARIVERFGDRGEPVGLTDDELDKSRQTPTMPHEPVPVHAWVRYPAESVRVEGHAIAWTRRAVLLEWWDESRVLRRVWLWASAVEHRRA